MAESESSKKGFEGSKGALAVVLSRLKGFESPKVRVEQYVTDAEIAAEVLWSAKMQHDIGKVSVDLGCGTGMLGVGLLLMGCEKVIFVDSDEESLEVAKDNVEKVKSEHSVSGKAEFLCRDVREVNVQADLVVQNPPFGTKMKHMDKLFLENALKIAGVVYSFHKSETKNFVHKIASDNNSVVKGVMDFKFPLKATYKHHRRRIHRINVSCFRLVKAKGF